MISKINSSISVNSNVYSNNMKSKAPSFNGAANFSSKSDYVGFMKKCSDFYNNLVSKKWQSLIGSEMIVDRDKARYTINCTDSFDSELKAMSQDFAKRNGFEFKFGPIINPTVK